MLTPLLRLPHRSLIGGDGPPGGSELTAFPNVPEVRQSLQIGAKMIT